MDSEYFKPRLCSLHDAMPAVAGGTSPLQSPTCYPKKSTETFADNRHGAVKLLHAFLVEGDCRVTARQAKEPIMDIMKFLKSWNGILLILIIGIYLVLPGLRHYFVVDDAGQGPPVNQLQLWVGGLAVLWAIKGIWDKQKEAKG